VKDIEILHAAIARKHPCDPAHAALSRIALDLQVNRTLISQRDVVAEAIVYTFEERPGWRTKVAAAVRALPESLITCFAARRSSPRSPEGPEAPPMRHHAPRHSTPRYH
jgi:hypothetical protein